MDFVYVSKVNSFILSAWRGANPNASRPPTARARRGAAHVCEGSYYFLRRFPPRTQSPHTSPRRPRPRPYVIHPYRREKRPVSRCTACAVSQLLSARRQSGRAIFILRWRVSTSGPSDSKNRRKCLSPRSTSLPPRYSFHLRVLPPHRA